MRWLKKKRKSEIICVKILIIYETFIMVDIDSPPKKICYIIYNANANYLKKTLFGKEQVSVENESNKMRWLGKRKKGERIKTRKKRNLFKATREICGWEFISLLMTWQTHQVGRIKENVLSTRQTTTTTPTLTLPPTRSLQRVGSLPLSLLSPIFSL